MVKSLHAKLKPYSILILTDRGSQVQFLIIVERCQCIKPHWYIHHKLPFFYGGILAEHDGMDLDDKKSG